MIKKITLIAALIVVSLINPISVQNSYAFHLCCNCGSTCGPLIKNCGGDEKTGCICQSNKDTPITIKHITDEFIQHREWLIKTMWEAHVLPAMMHMTNQMTAVALQQAKIIGTLFDAKHQLETQRLLQLKRAQAHKDYHPSEGMCQIGTTTRSLAAADRNSDLTQIALAAHTTQRQLLNGDVSSGSASNDIYTRFNQFRGTYCNPADFGNGLKRLCKDSDPKRYNKDINFNHIIDNTNSLEIDFNNSDTAEDEEDILALSNNLYGSQIFPRIPEDKMADKDGNIIPAGAFAYMKTRAMTAKRSVAQTAFTAQAAMKAEGGEEVFPYMEAILKEMGIAEKDVKTMIGEKPSYYAQMELLTKKLYQTPHFYTELYDKPTNIDRKKVSMQAIDLMQKRDIYRSSLRSEAMMAIWLEANTKDLENFYVNETNTLKSNTKILTDLPLK